MGAVPLTRFSAATLSVYSETGSAAAVTALLGLEPYKVSERGDRRIGRTGREYPAYTASAWNYAPAESQIVHDDTGFAALRALLNDIAGLADALAALRPEYRTIIRWAGGVSAQGNFVIEADMIVSLGALGCEFFGTAYPEESEDEAGPET